ncbi:MAG: pentapeptide repeat-containing protein [Rickettsiales bacterium]|nr:hypothetical protein [Methyloglobulus sp.]
MTVLTEQAGCKTLSFSHAHTNKKLIERTQFALSYSDLLVTASKVDKDLLMFSDLSSITFSNRTIDGMDFFGSNMRDTIFNKMTFVECNFSECLMVGTSMFDCVFHDCRFDEAFVYGVETVGCVFYG